MTVYIGTSWKMNKTVAEARSYVRELSLHTPRIPGLQVFVIPPHTAIQAVHDELDPAAGVWVGAQNAHWALDGPYTGEVSMKMVKDVGASMVELGHSERREHFNETDEVVGLKVRAAVDAGLIPLVCVGESLAVRRGGGALAHVLAQVEAALAGIDPEARRDVLLAYEPIWSIGDAGTPARPEQVEEIARGVSDGFGIRGLLYGGSVDLDNAADFLAVPDIDGLFVGRAGWQAAAMATLISLAEKHLPRPAGGRR